MEPISTSLTAESTTTTPTISRRSATADRELAEYWRQVHRAVAGEIEPTLPDDEPEAVCPGGCNNTGWRVKRWLPVGHPDAFTANPCPVCKAPGQARRRVDRIFGAAEVPELLENLTFDTYRFLPTADQGARAKVETWAEDGPGSLYLWGKVGRGKTGLAAAALRQRMEQTSCDSLFRATPNLLGRIRDSYSNREGAPTEAEVVDAVTNVTLLVLDDIGTDKPTDWVVATLYRILNDRYLHQRATIFTSNFDLVQLGKMLGNRISWRIKQMCEPNVIQVQGENLRDQAA